MRILMFCPYYPPHAGGLEQYAQELSLALCQAHPEVRITVLTPQLPATAPAVEQVGRNMHIYRYPAVEIIPNFPCPKFWSQPWRKLLGKLAGSRPEVIVSHTRFFLSSYLAMRFARRVKAPLVHIEHGSTEVRQGSWLINAVAAVYDQTLGRAVLTNSHINLAVSQASAAFVRQFDPRPVTVLYRGVDASEFGPFQTRAVTHEPTIIFVGRLLYGKGVHDLLAALKAIKRGFRLLIVGDGPERTALTELAAQSGLSRRVVFTGALPRHEVIKLLKTADIFVNPSYTEGLPTTVLEAGLAGAAIVATDVGGTNEIIVDQDNGLLVPAGEVGALTAAIKTLLNDPALRQRLGAQAAKRIGRRFRWQKSVTTFMTVLSHASRH